MKKYLLPETGNFYKANLHCHSNLSDGALSPEELKRIYKEKGYSVLAYTDHDILISHDELADKDFLPLHGFEYEINEQGVDWHYAKTCHICFIGIDPDNITQPLYNPDYLFGNAPNFKDKVVHNETEPYYVREYSGAGISEIMQHCRDKGFFVTYNHPSWSGESYPQYIGYKGMHAFEICNSTCNKDGYGDYNPRVYDDILRIGNHIFALATDDNHNHGTPGTKSWDSFGGFTMIKAEKLEYSAITDALVKGNFYASQGPEIYSLWVENGIAHITFSKAESVACNSGQRYQRVKWAEEGEYITEAAFEIQPWDKYIRFTVTDHRGKHANTNAYLVDEILK